MYKKFIKRGLDLTVSLCLLILFSPLILLLWLLLKCVFKDAIFKQERPGLNEKIFTVYKFKTMSDEKDASGALLADELRLKSFGKVVRSLSLDELPQLFNVLKGDMSLIGPRPLLVKYLPLYSPEQRRRHELRPGITGLAQVNGRNDISWAKKFEYDVYYVEHCSFFLDTKIALLTLFRVLQRSGVSKSGLATSDEFNGSN
ncbi:sugar transferase [Campylobacter troglodytis]|uniref:sugar transferase n=1 Tax=Campylobacter troglodytis TaxID=654363 RepID=UPI001159AB12|nr:sugar transferase [Campylobacter troglodytis]TQR61009.1 lipid carrier--UDP-N-acetylgalactosaminyltransferase [Campylobacter troglodytis]